VENSTQAAQARPDSKGINPQESRQPLAGIVAVPAWMVTHPEIDSTSLRVYCYLVARYNRRTGIAFPSAPTISDGLDISVRQVRRCIKHLRGLGLIAVKSRHWGSGRQKNNGYVPLFGAWDKEGWKKGGQECPPSDLGGDRSQAVICDTGVTHPDTPGVTPTGVSPASPLVIEPIASTERTNPPQSPQPGGRLPDLAKTRKEKDLIHRLSPALWKTCPGCNEQIQERDLAKRSQWGILEPAVVSVEEQQGWMPVTFPPGATASLKEAQEMVSPYDYMHWLSPIRVVPGPEPEVWCPDAAHAEWVESEFSQVLEELFPEGYVLRHQDTRRPEPTYQIYHAACRESR